jgi:hypothetical protein
VADIPQQIVLRRHRDLRSAAFNKPARWGLLLVLGGFLVLGLVNAFGQRPQTLTLDTSQAKLSVYVPEHLRGGLLYDARFTITAHRDMKNVALLLSPGWAEGMQINTMEPSPVSEGSRHGDLLLTFGHLPAGDVLRFFMAFQTNATNLAWHRRADVALYDGARRLGTIHRSVTVFP